MISNNNKVICADCGSEMILKETHKFKTKGNFPRKFYGCSRFPDCRATHGAHSDGRPLGVPGNAKTKAMRIESHKLLNQWQLATGCHRKQLYKKLEKEFNKPIYFGKLGYDECLKVIDFLIHDIKSIGEENERTIKKLDEIRKSCS